MPHGNTVAPPADPTRQAFEFAWWVHNGQPYDFATPVVEDITLTAEWKEVPVSPVTVTFDPGNGDPLLTREVTSGDTVVQPQDPTREGFIFQGWALGDAIYDFSTPVTSDLYLTAVWEKVPALFFTVTFDPGNGAAFTQLVRSGDPAVEPSAPARAGFTFAGWMPEGATYDFNTPVSGDLWLTAHWKPVVAPPITTPPVIAPPLPSNPTPPQQGVAESGHDGTGMAVATAATLLTLGGACFAVSRNRKRPGKPSGFVS